MKRKAGPANCWQLQEAKARLSELVKKVEDEGPQEITVRGEPAVVVVARAEYEKLRSRGRPRNLVDFLLNSPLAGLQMDFERDRSPAREAALFDDKQ
jgi:antitoxin Phd